MEDEDEELWGAFCGVWRALAWEPVTELDEPEGGAWACSRELNAIAATAHTEGATRKNLQENIILESIAFPPAFRSDEQNQVGMDMEETYRCGKGEHTWTLGERLLQRPALRRKQLCAGLGDVHIVL